MSMPSLGKLSRRETVGIAASAAVILCLGGDWALIRPLHRRFARIGTECALLEQGLARGQRTLGRRDAVEAAYRKVSGFVAKRSANQSDERAMLAEIESLAGAAGVSIADSKVQAVQPLDFVDLLTVEVRVEGDSGRLAEFLRQVEAAPQLLRVKRMELKPSEKNPERMITGILTITKIVSA